MGTRSTTTVYDYDGTPLVTVYRQFDGYWSGHGRELADFLTGLSQRQHDSTYLAAHVVAFIVGECDRSHLYPLESKQGHNYQVRLNVKEDKTCTIRLVCEVTYGEGEVAFDGHPSAYDLDTVEEDSALEEAHARLEALGKLNDKDKKVLGLTT